MPSLKSHSLEDPINPDGVPINVVWEDLVVGASVFIPAVNTVKLIKQMKAESKRQGLKLEPRHRIENGKLGVRFWRIA